MKISNRSGAARRSLFLALAFASSALSMAAVSAQAAVDPVTISAAVVRVVKITGPDSMTGAPTTEVRATSVVKFDPVTLTTHSGVALLKDAVRAAALQACEAAAPLSMGYQRCLNRVVQSTRPQVDAAIARARSHSNA